MSRPFIIDVEDLDDDISGTATLLEQYAEMHKEETLLKLLKTGRISVCRETPLRGNKAVKFYNPFLQTTSTGVKQGFPSFPSQKCEGVTCKLAFQIHDDALKKGRIW